MIASDEARIAPRLIAGRETLLLTSMHAGDTRSSDGPFGGSGRDRKLPAGTTAEQAARAAKVQRMLSGANMYVSIAHKLKFEVGFNPLVDKEQPDDAEQEDDLDVDPSHLKPQRDEGADGDGADGDGVDGVGGEVADPDPATGHQGTTQQPLIDREPASREQPVDSPIVIL